MYYGDLQTVSLIPDNRRVPGHFDKEQQQQTSYPSDLVLAVGAVYR